MKRHGKGKNLPQINADKARIIQLPATLKVKTKTFETRRKEGNRGKD